MPAPTMTVAAYKLFFRDVLGNGWSEVYHQKPASWAGADFPTILDGLVTDRAPALNDKCSIIYGTASDVGLAGDIKAIASGLPVQGTANADYLGAGDAMYLRMHAAMDQFTPRLFRGLSKTDFDARGDIDGFGPFAVAIPAFLTNLKGAHFGVFHTRATRRFAQYSFQDYIDGERFIRGGHRDVGRPFGLLRGRRP